MQQGLVVAVIIGGLLFIAGQYVASQPQRVEQEIDANREITVNGTGKAVALPNMAKFSAGVTTGPQASAEQAMEIMAERFNAVLEAVQDAGVEERDVRTTNLAVNPVYDFDNGRQNLRGFEASQNVEVTMRDLENVGSVVAAATNAGANQLGGIRFEADDIEQVKLQAQQSAIEDARTKADQLADALGVNLGRVKAFSDMGEFGPPVPLFARDAVGGEVAESAIVPQVPPGEQEIESNVAVTFELR